MAKCDICVKGVSFGIKVSHSHRRSNRTWKPNVRRVRAIVNGTPKAVNVCTRCLRSGKVTRAVWEKEFLQGFALLLFLSFVNSWGTVFEWVNKLLTKFKNITTGYMI